MTALNKQALREAAQEEIMLRSVGDTSDAWQDEASPEAVLALLDENYRMTAELDALRENIDPRLIFTSSWSKSVRLLLAVHWLDISTASRNV